METITKVNGKDRDKARSQDLGLNIISLNDTDDSGCSPPKNCTSHPTYSPSM
jgi:hypothetical protein